jgi:hypothetical protein
MDELAFSPLQTVSCIKCKQAFVFEPGKIQGNLKDDHGNLLTQ